MRERSRAVLLLFGMAYRADPWRSTLVLLLQVAVPVAFVLDGLWVKMLVDGTITHDQRSIVLAAIGVGASLGLAGSAALLQLVLSSGVSERTGQAFDEHIARLIGEVPGIEHHERPDYLDRLTMLRAHRAQLGQGFAAIVQNLGLIAQVALTALLLGRVQPLLLVLPLFALPTLALTGRGQLAVMRANERVAHHERRAAHLRALAGSPSAGREVRTFGLRDDLLRRHREELLSANAARDRAATRALGLTTVGSLSFALGYAAAVALVAYRTVHHLATPGDLVLTASLAAQVNGQVAQAGGVVVWVVSVMRTVSHVLWLRDYARRATAAPHHPRPVPTRITHGIDLDHVSFRYPGTDVDVLTDVTLHIPAGATVAIVGENGAGKTTLVKLLHRFYEPASGRILVDGEDLCSLPVDEWRTRHAACFQDFASFQMAARESVGLGDLQHIDDLSRVGTALDRAGAADLRDTLPQGLETQLGKLFPHGVDLSGGQWQKVALGRAMMREEPLILTLDEPTSALDAQTEFALFERYVEGARRVAQRSGGITVLVSHRFSTVRMADVIVVIEQGRVREVGDHAELLRLGGIYSELYGIQAAAYR